MIDGEDEALRDQCFAQYILQTLQELPHQTKVTEKMATSTDSHSTFEPSKQKLR